MEEKKTTRKEEKKKKETERRKRLVNNNFSTTAGACQETGSQITQTVEKLRHRGRPDTREDEL